MRLDKLKHEFGDLLQVEWRAFLLRPKPEERTLAQFRSYTEHWSRPASLEPGCTFGQWTDNPPPSHSVPSALAGKAAASFGADAFDAFKQRALETYFRDCRTISDRDVLVDVAGAAGIDQAEFARRVDDDARAFAEQVIADHNEAVECGITGVPAVVVNREHLLTGALEVEQYRKVIRHLAGIDA